MYPDISHEYRSFFAFVFNARIDFQFHQKNWLICMGHLQNPRDAVRCLRCPLIALAIVESVTILYHCWLLAMLLQLPLPPLLLLMVKCAAFSVKFSLRLAANVCAPSENLHDRKKRDKTKNKLVEIGIFSVFLFVNCLKIAFKERHRRQWRKKSNNKTPVRRLLSV